MPSMIPDRKEPRPAGARNGFISRWQFVFAFIYLSIAGLAAWQTITHTNASTEYLDQACARKSIANEGVQVAAKYQKHHQIVGSFIVSYLGRNSDFPSLTESARALAGIPLLNQDAGREESLAAGWSWFLLGLSLVYLALAAAQGGGDRVRGVLFALTGVSAVFFAIGISASAMMILTSIHDFYGAAPVIQHEVRSVSSVIVELFSTGHWIFAGFITLFSVVTPCVKIALTFVAGMTLSPSKSEGISKFLNAIGKWSMADVFVAAVLLACFTIKSSGGVEVIPFRGLYYFAAYCLVSMVTTSLLHQLNFGKELTLFDSEGQLRIPAVGELAGVALFLSSIYMLKH